MQQRLAAEAVHEPEVLVGGDVREVPDQRAHDRVELALELGVVEVRDERERAARGWRQGFHEGCGHRSAGRPPDSPDVTGGPGGLPPRRHAGTPHGRAPPGRQLRHAREHFRRPCRPLERPASQDGDLGLAGLRHRLLRHRLRRRLKKPPTRTTTSASRAAPTSSSTTPSPRRRTRASSSRPPRAARRPTPPSARRSTTSSPASPSRASPTSSRRTPRATRTRSPRTGARCS